jgi:hypothetical protein
MIHSLYTLDENEHQSWASHWLVQWKTVLVEADGKIRPILIGDCCSGMAVIDGGWLMLFDEARH